MQNGETDGGLHLFICAGWKVAVLACLDLCHMLHPVRGSPTQDLNHPRIRLTAFLPLLEGQQWQSQALPLACIFRGWYPPVRQYPPTTALQSSH